MITTAHEAADVIEKAKGQSMKKLIEKLEALKVCTSGKKEPVETDMREIRRLCNAMIDDCIKVVKEYEREGIERALKHKEQEEKTMLCSVCGTLITFSVVEIHEPVELSRFDPDLEIGLYQCNGKFQALLECKCGKCVSDAADDFELVNKTRGVEVFRVSANR